MSIILQLLLLRRQLIMALLPKLQTTFTFTLHMNYERLSDKHNIGIKEPNFTVTLFSCFHYKKHQLLTIDVPNS